MEGFSNCLGVRISDRGGVVVEKRLNGNGRRKADQYCPQHEFVVGNQRELRSWFKWLIGMHITELLAIIGGLFSIVKGG